MRKYDKAQLAACLLVLLAEVVTCAILSVLLWAAYKILSWGV